MKGVIRILDDKGNVISETPFDDGKDEPKCPCPRCPHGRRPYVPIYPQPYWPDTGTAAPWQPPQIWWTTGGTFPPSTTTITVNATLPTAQSVTDLADKIANELRRTGV